MSKGELLYVKGMNDTQSEEDEGEVDIWDDRKLNDAYDKALRIANAEVAKRVAMSTNSALNKITGNKMHSRDKNKPSSSTKIQSHPKTEWKAGMACRALYECDGQEYEAFVLRVINDRECVVRFLGYNNSELVLIDKLKPSLGKEEQAKQIEQALIENGDNDDYGCSSHDTMNISDRVGSPTSTEKSFYKKKKPTKKKKSHTQNATETNRFELPDMPFQLPNMSQLRNLGSMDLPLPPPPPINISSSIECEEQAVSSMLLSWYMSGYYTGLYQGMKRSKENRRN